MVDDDLVAAIWAEGCLNGLCYGSTCFYVADYGTVFGFVAGSVSVGWRLILGSVGCTFGNLA